MNTAEQIGYQLIDNWSNIPDGERYEIIEAMKEYAEQVTKHHLKEASYEIDANLSERKRVRDFQVTTP